MPAKTGECKEPRKSSSKTGKRSAKDNKSEDDYESDIEQDAAEDDGSEGESDEEEEGGDLGFNSTNKFHFHKMNSADRTRRPLRKLRSVTIV